MVQGVIATNSHRRTPEEYAYRDVQARLCQGPLPQTVADEFPLYCSRQRLTKYLARYELFKLALEVKGDIVECGVGWGGGLLLWAQLTSIFTPYNHNQRVIGFDTFGDSEGFTSLTDEDGTAHSGYTFTHNLQHVQDAVACYDLNRACGHLPKVQLVQGDACETIPQYLDDNPHTVIKILSIDFDIYAPTKVALEQFIPRMPAGAILILDQTGNALWPGETRAVLEMLGLRGVWLRQLPWEPAISYVLMP